MRRLLLLTAVSLGLVVGEPGAALAAGEPAAPASDAVSPTSAALDDSPPPAKTTTKKKKKKKRKKKSRRQNAPPRSRDDVDWSPEPGIGGQATLRAGALSGVGVRSVQTATLEVATGLSPELRLGWFRLASDLRLAHRQTLGAHLEETRGRADLSLQVRPHRRLRAAALLGLRGVWRPGWDDLYQPLDGGALARTDRYSHWDRVVGGRLMGIPWPHHHLRLGYRYLLSDYVSDPAFDAVARPDHLTPFDHDRHQLDVSWRYLGRPLRLQLAASAWRRESFFAFARDAGSGHTHAGPGGAPPNPLLQLWGVEPWTGVAVVLLQRRLILEARYGHEIVEDVFQGYYSYRGHHPELGVTWRPLPRLSAELAIEGWLRTFGDGSYQPGPGHPALSYGRTREDNRLRARVHLRWKLARRLDAVAEGEWSNRRTNFPDYVPGLFPGSQGYDIRWTYQNGLARCGLDFTY